MKVDLIFLARMTHSFFLDRLNARCSQEHVYGVQTTNTTRPHSISSPVTHSSLYTTPFDVYRASLEAFGRRFAGGGGVDNARTSSSPPTCTSTCRGRAVTGTTIAVALSSTIAMSKRYSTDDNRNITSTRSKEIEIRRLYHSCSPSGLGGESDRFLPSFAGRIRSLPFFGLSEHPPADTKLRLWQH
jgi:hypothetical protein